MNNAFSEIIFSRAVIFHTDKLSVKINKFFGKINEHKKYKMAVKQIKYGDLTYKMLENYSEFISSMEKVYFYKNNESESSFKFKLTSTGPKGCTKHPGSKYITMYYPGLQDNISLELFENNNDENIIIKAYNSINKSFIIIPISNMEFIEPLDSDEFALYFNIEHDLRIAMRDLFIYYYNYSKKYDKL